MSDQPPVEETSRLSHTFFVQNVPPLRRSSNSYIYDLVTSEKLCAIVKRNRSCMAKHCITKHYPVISKSDADQQSWRILPSNAECFERYSIVANRVSTSCTSASRSVDVGTVDESPSLGQLQPRASCANTFPSRAWRFQPWDMFLGRFSAIASGGIKSVDPAFFLLFS